MLGVEDVAGNENLITKLIASKGFENIYIHIDLDVLDPNEFPNVKCPVPEGLTIERLIGLIDELKNNFSVVGDSIVEYSPKKDIYTRNICALIEKLFDQKI